MTCSLARVCAPAPAVRKKSVSATRRATFMQETIGTQWKAVKKRGLPGDGPSASVDAERQARRQGGAGFRAAPQVVFADLFRGENRVGGLGVGADDDRLGNDFQTPAGGDALYLAGGAFAVAAGADQDCVRAPGDSVQHRIVG